jgi:hypothetical protein
MNHENLTSPLWFSLRGADTYRACGAGLQIYRRTSKKFQKRSKNDSSPGTPMPILSNREARARPCLPFKEISMAEHTTPAISSSEVGESIYDKEYQRLYNDACDCALDTFHPTMQLLLDLGWSAAEIAEQALSFCGADLDLKMIEEIKQLRANRIERDAGDEEDEEEEGEDEDVFAQELFGQVLGQLVYQGWALVPERG